MSKISMQEKLDIINSGGEVDVTGEHGSWYGVKIRKGNKIGKVVKDTNSFSRALTVRFDDGLEETIELNNVGPDSAKVHQYEFYISHENIWCRF